MASTPPSSVLSSNKSTALAKYLGKQKDGATKYNYKGKKSHAPPAVIILQDDQIGAIIFKLNDLVKKSNQQFKVQIVIDNRELRNKELVYYLETLHAAYKEKMHMTTADFCWLINRKSAKSVERKRLDDMVASIISGHYNHQKTELNVLLTEYKGHRDRVVFLYEKSVGYNPSTTKTTDAVGEEKEQADQETTPIQEKYDALVRSLKRMVIGDDLDNNVLSPWNTHSLASGALLSNMCHRACEGHQVMITESGAQTVLYLLKSLLWYVEHAQETWAYYGMEHQDDFNNDQTRANEAKLQGPDLVAHMHHQEVEHIEKSASPASLLTLTEAQRHLASFLFSVKGVSSPYALMISKEFDNLASFFKYIRKTHKKDPQLIVDRFAQSVPDLELSRGKPAKRMGGARVASIINYIHGTRYKTKIKSKRDVIVMPDDDEEEEEKNN